MLVLPSTLFQSLHQVCTQLERLSNGPLSDGTKKSLTNGGNGSWRNLSSNSSPLLGDHNRNTPRRSTNLSLGSTLTPQFCMWLMGFSWGSLPSLVLEQQKWWPSTAIFVTPTRNIHQLPNYPSPTWFYGWSWWRSIGRSTLKPPLRHPLIWRCGRCFDGSMSKASTTPSSSSSQPPPLGAKN